MLVVPAIVVMLEPTVVSDGVGDELNSGSAELMSLLSPVVPLVEPMVSCVNVDAGTKSTSADLMAGELIVEPTVVSFGVADGVD